MEVRRFLECCCTDAGEAQEAQAGGARRIELCEDLRCGGITPGRKNIIETLQSVEIPVNVLVRARGGDFVYTEDEVQAMLESVRMCRELGVNGVVVGALRKDGSIDTETVRRLIAEANGLEVTFHRAFDECSEPFSALEDIISLGCGRLLTAGHASDVNDGEPMLKKLVEIAGHRIIILAGSGVRPCNIARIEAAAGVREFHSSSHGTDGRTSRNIVAAMTGVGPCGPAGVPGAASGSHIR
jgi:copper homeostasis protein